MTTTFRMEVDSGGMVMAEKVRWRKKTRIWTKVTKRRNS